MIGRVALAAVATVTAGAAVFTAGLPVSSTAAVTPLASTTIPARYLQLYQQAALACPGLSWTVLAGVGEVESDHGRAPHLTSTAGAQGPMQFEPSTWARYGVDGDGDGRADPFDPADAIPAAASYLCTLGVTRDPTAALVAYNCGDAGAGCRALSTGYATRVLAWAARYGSGVTAAAATVAVQAALAQLGTPYVWGGAAPGGFDCSGLVQWAYARGGIALPRVAQDQFDAGPTVVAGTPLLPGDLLFFGASRHGVSHVGIYLGDGRFIDAPHSGAAVRVDVIAGFTPGYLGATRPAGGVG